MVRTSRPLYHLTPTKVAISSIASTKRCHMPASSTRTASRGSSTADYRAIWRKRPNGPPESASGKCWARWGTQHWFFTDRTHPFRRSPASRALRQALEVALREFHGGDHDGPVARRLIKETEKERARARQIWDARIAKRDRLASNLHPINGGAPWSIPSNNSARRYPPPGLPLQKSFLRTASFIASPATVIAATTLAGTSSMQMACPPDGSVAFAAACYEPWRADIGRKLTPQEIAEHWARVEAIQRKREAEDAKRKAQARRKAAEMWNAAEPAPADHPYLTRKGIKPHGARVQKGFLTVPLYDGDELYNLQFIGADGGKRFLKGGRVDGCCYIFGKPTGTLCLAEGFATAASIHECTGHPVAIAFGSGNLPPVARYDDAHSVLRFVSKRFQ
jgi:hypothetical protein